MPKWLPGGFKRDVVDTARQGALTIPAVATDFGATEETVRRRMLQVGTNKDIKDGVPTAEKSELMQLRQDERDLDMARGILLSTAAYVACRWFR